MDRVGIPMNNHNNWRVGQELMRFAAERNIQPVRKLTRKTNPHPTVPAPHCIAHYPMELFESAVIHIKRMWESNPDNPEGFQGQLFDL